MAEKRKPNVLFLYADQHSPTTMSCVGHSVIRTPHMDRLAREGVLFENAYTPTPLCMPARVELLTNRYAHNNGILYNQGLTERDDPTCAQAFQAAGYHACVTGKIHFCQGPKPGTSDCNVRLREMGFHEPMANNGKVFAAIGDQDDMYRKYLKEKGVFERFREDYVERHYGVRVIVRPSVLSEEDFHDAYIGRITRDWLAAYDGEQPFFCWCNWGGPHSPWDAPGRYAEMYDPRDMDPPIDDPMEHAPTALRERQRRQASRGDPDIWRACRASYYGMINVVDDAIGSMLDALEERDVLEDTIVIYTADHGEMLYDHGLTGKSVMYEGSARVPLIVRWPRRFMRGARSDALVSTLDAISTILETAGAAPMVQAHGRSLLPVLTGESEAHRECVFSEMGPIKMVRHGPWKYVYRPGWDVQQLFNLEEDPDEVNNLAGVSAGAERERALRDSILDWMIETEARPNTLTRSATESEVSF